MFDMNQAYFMGQFEELLAIDSTTGDFRPIQNYVKEQIKEMGYESYETHKGGLLADLGGTGNSLVVTAHLDDIGLMVRFVNPDGTLRVAKVGGLSPEDALGENVRVKTRDNRVYTGTVQKKFASVHVTEDDVAAKPLDYATNMVVVLDEDVHTAEETKALGVDIGCFIALEPRLQVCNGYIKSRFIDDKVCCAVLLAAMKEMKEAGMVPKRNIKAYFGMFEEIGHGTSWVPAETKDILALDIACVGPCQNSDEKKVSIFAMDSRFPYHYEMSNEIIDVAKKCGADYVIDVFTPHYGSDGNTTVLAGHDVRHAAMGQGTSVSHGYERTHIDGVKNLYNLLLSYMMA